MFNLTRLERIILIVLCFILFTGLTVMAYRRSFTNTNIHISRFQISDETAPGAVGCLLPERSKININEAPAEDLMKIKGVGKVLAGRIVFYRSSNRLFVSIEDLKKVKGIGQAMFDKIKDRITIE